MCIKTAGREAGKKCVVVDTADEGMVVISGPGVKRRRCNPLHLQPLPEVKKITKGAPEKDVYSLFGVEFKEKAPAKKPVKKEEKPAEKKEEKKPAEKKEPEKKKEEKKPAAKKKEKKKG